MGTQVKLEQLIVYVLIKQVRFVVKCTTWERGGAGVQKTSSCKLHNVLHAFFYYYHYSYYTERDGWGLLGQGRGRLPTFIFVFLYNRTTTTRDERTGGRTLGRTNLHRVIRLILMPSWFSDGFSKGWLPDRNRNFTENAHTAKRHQCQQAGWRYDGMFTPLISIHHYDHRRNHRIETAATTVTPPGQPSTVENVELNEISCSWLCDGTSWWWKTWKID